MSQKLNMEKESAIHHEDRPSDQLDELQKTSTVDTLHNDEATKVLARHGSDETYSPDEEKKLRRKIDRKLLPILCITYGESLPLPEAESALAYVMFVICAASHSCPVSWIRSARSLCMMKQI